MYTGDDLGVFDEKTLLVPQVLCSRCDYFTFGNFTYWKLKIKFKLIYHSIVLGKHNFELMSGELDT